MIDQAFMHATLHVDGIADDTLEVVEFKGTDTISKPYEFKILCASSDDSLSSRRMSRNPAKLSLSWAKWENSYSGILFAFQKMQTVDKLTFYIATLSPRLRLLELTQHNQVFLKMSLPEILESVLKECGVREYEIRFTSEHLKMEYVCQYNETHFNFISRWMEHSGIYYFFEETESGEKLIITDSKIVHTPLSEQAFPFRQVSGMDEGEKLRSIFVLTREERIVPKEIVLKDYNYQRPDIELLVTAEVDQEGMGRTYSYGDHFPTTAQGKVLAKIRAEELLCGKTIFHGQGGCLPFRAGRLYSLSGHPDQDFNASYLLTSVEHTGRTSSPLVSGVGAGAEFKDNYGYRNVFAALPGDGQFRPARVAGKTKIEGMINAVVDAEGSGQYAELDEQGRYKVRLPFDLANEPSGHASHWLRMAQPYAGENYGMHFPLHKGTGVMLGFVNADPDRPFITSAVHDGEKANPIHGNNARLGGIKSAGNNQLLFCDTEGQEAAALWSPYHNSGIAVGSVKQGGGGSILTSTAGDNDTIVLGSSFEGVLGQCTQVVVGATNYCYGGSLTNVVGPLALNLNWGTSFTYTHGAAMSFGDSSTDMSTTIKQAAQESLTLAAGVPFPAAGLLTKAKRAMARTGVGVALASAGAVATTECFSSDGVWSQDGSATLGGSIGATALGIGALVSAVAAYAGSEFCRQFLEKTTKSMVSTMTLDQSGVKVDVKPNAFFEHPKFSVVVGPTLVEGECSYFTINSEGSISAKCCDELDTLSMSKEEGTIISRSNGGAQTINNNGVMSKMKDGGSVDVTRNGVLVKSQDGTSKINTTNASIELTTSGGNTAISMGNNLTMTFADTCQIKPANGHGGIRISPSGTVYIN